MSESQGSTTYSGINTKNIIITDAAKQTLLTGLSAEAMADRVFTATTTENAEALSGALANRFDAAALQKELDTQREVSQAFSQNVQSAKAELNRAADRLTADYEAGRISQAEYDAKRQQLDNGALLLSTIAAGLSAPTNSALGIATATLSPSVAKEIGQYFKSTDREGSTEHLIAHGLLAAAVAATGGNNALTAAGAAISAEAAAPVLAHYLYGKAAADLNADEKATISSITSLVGAGVGATTGADANLAQGAQSAGTAVDNNFLTAIKQYPEFGQEMEAACAMSAEACQETRQKWYDLSVKQSGLTEEGVVAWHEKLDATFKNLYAQCQGDTSCVAYLDLQKESASITHLGLHEELGVLGINLKHTLDIQQGNWGTLALDALADFGDFIPAVTTKPISQGVDKLVELGGEVFVLSKGVWSKATGSVADSAKSVAQTQQLRHELFDNFTGTKAQIKQAEITINGHLIKANPQISEGAAIFDGVSEQDVMSYFKQLTGVDNLPKAEKIPHLKDLDGNQAIFYAVKKDGLTYNLRNGSSSIDKTKARWTIEVTGVKGYQVGERVLTRKFVEVKFR